MKTTIQKSGDFLHILAGDLHIGTLNINHIAVIAKYEAHFNLSSPLRGFTKITPVSGDAFLVSQSVREVLQAIGSIPPDAPEA